MNQPIESDLRAALRARADQVPVAAVARLTALDYRPRTRRVQRPAALGALATAGAAAGAVAVISLSAGASNAFAGWTPQPTPPSPGQLAAARASCQRGQSPIAGLPLALADTRGPFTFSIYADSTSSATCIQGPSFTAVSGTMSSSPTEVPAGHILLAGSHTTDRAAGAYTLAEGRTGAGVTGVTLRLDDGSDVQATVGNGWFVAWWPGGHLVKSAALRTATGVTTQTFDQAAPPLPPGTTGGGRVSQGSSSGGGSAGSTGRTESFGGSQ